jgi:ribosomal protein S18 acetylase RimI-like enzyme
LRKQDASFAVGYLAFEPDAPEAELERLRAVLTPFYPANAQNELCFNVYGRNRRAVDFLQSVGFSLDFGGYKYEYRGNGPLKVSPADLERRPYGAGDLGAYADLFDRAYARLREQKALLSNSWSHDPSALGRRLEEAEAVGELDAFWSGGRLIGLCLTRSDGYVTDLAVHPELQNHGYGQAILARVVNRMLAQGCPRIHLDVAASNTGAQRFYLRYGFVETGCFADHTFRPR